MFHLYHSLVIVAAFPLNDFQKFRILIPSAVTSMVATKADAITPSTRIIAKLIALLFTASY